MRIMRELPRWLREDYVSPSKRKSYESTRDYFRAMLRATPEWAKTKEAREKFYAVYREMRRRRARGENVVVDHIVPLRGRYVSGLNIWYNLQIIHAKPNGAKSNTWWPGHPCENEDMFGELAPYQMRLF